MSLIDCHQERKPFILRFISGFLIVTFLVTQTEMQSVFANPVQAPAAAVNPLDKKDLAGLDSKDHEEGHYLQDFSQWNETSLSEKEISKATSSATSSDQGQGSQAPVPSSTLGDQMNPLLAPDPNANPTITKREVTEILSDGTTVIWVIERREYPNGTFYELKYRKDGGPASQPKIHRIGDFTNPDDPKKIEIRNFSYKEIAGSSTMELVTIHTESGISGEVDRFQRFEADKVNGNLGRIVCEGIAVTGEAGTTFIEQTVYNYVRNTVSVKDLFNAGVVWIYKLDPETGKKGRASEYWNMDQNTHIGFHYDDAAKTVTSISLSYAGGQTFFATYTYDNKLMKLGTVKAINQDGSVQAGDVVELAELDRDGKKTPVYLFSSEGSSDKVIRERLVQGDDPVGVVGRILEYNGLKYEYKYEYKEADAVTGMASVTIINTKEQTWVRVEIPRNSLVDWDGRVETAKLAASGIIELAVVPNFKVLAARVSEKAFILYDKEGKVLEAREFSNNEIGQIIWTRGPPEEGKITEWLYQDASGKPATVPTLKISYDLLTKTYLIQDEKGIVYESGRFSEEPNGLLKRDAVYTYDPSLPHYDPLQAQKGSYVMDLLEQAADQRIPFAAIVDLENMTVQEFEEFFERLRQLGSEAAYGILNGQFVVYTSGDEHQIRGLESAKPLFDKMSVWGHVHPEDAADDLENGESAKNLKSGPSIADMRLATEKDEYLVTSEGVFVFNNTRSEKISIAQLFEIFKAALREPSNTEETLARAELHQFIESAERLKVIKTSETAEEYEKESFGFREGGPEEEEAYGLGEAHLSDLLDVEAAEFNRVSIVEDPSDANIYTLVLEYDGIQYEYKVNIKTDAILSFAKIVITETGKRKSYYDPSSNTLNKIEEYNADNQLSAVQIYDRAKGQLIKMDYIQKTFQIYTLNSDDQQGEILFTGFFNDKGTTDANNEGNHIGPYYSIQKATSGDGSETTPIDYYSYGPNGIKEPNQTGSDDVKLPGDPSKAKSSGSQNGSSNTTNFSSPGGSDDGKFKKLLRMIKNYINCNSLAQTDQNKYAQCMALLGQIERLQRALGDDGGGGGGGSTTSNQDGSQGLDPNEMNMQTDKDPADLTPDADGEGRVPDEKYLKNKNEDDTERLYEKDGKESLWMAGEDGEFGTGDDILHYTEKDVSGKRVRTYYDHQTRRAKKMVEIEDNGNEKLLAEYEYDDDKFDETDEGEARIIEPDGTVYMYKYKKNKDPWASPTKIGARLKKKDKWVERTYDEKGRVTAEKDEESGEVTTFEYDNHKNVVKIKLPNGKVRIVDMGGDHEFGTGDDFLVDGDDDNLEKTFDQNGKLVKIRDTDTGEETEFEYNDHNEVTITTKLNGKTKNRSVVRLGEDGELGTEDDRFKVVEGEECAGGECREFYETFDSQGRITSRNGAKKVPKRDANGNLLKEDGSIAYTEDEAAFELRDQLITYSYDDTKKLVTITTQEYDEEGNLKEPILRITYKLGSEGLLDLGMVVYEDRYDFKRKRSIERYYDDKGRIILLRDKKTGNELRYKYDEANRKVKVITGNGDIEQEYEFDEGVELDGENLQQGRLVFEKRNNQKRTWDKHGKVTATTDKDGNTSYFKNGNLSKITDKDGNVIADYEMFLDSVTKRVTDVNVLKPGITSDSICLNPPACTSWNLVYSEGTVVHYVTDGEGQIVNWNHVSGPEFTQNMETIYDEESGIYKLHVYFNDGREIIYSQVAGRYEIDVSIDIYGARTTYFYYTKGRGVRASLTGSAG